MLNWVEICAIEPRLVGVAMYAKMLGVDQTYQHYEAVKARLDPLVGRCAEKEALRTTEAWMVAFKHLEPMVCP